MSTMEPLPESPGAQPPKRGWRRIFGDASDPLGPNYRKLWVASTVSNLGDGVRLTAFPLMAASITRDPAQISLIGFASTLPWFLFALVSGAVVDRVDRRKAMGLANIGRAVLVGLLAIGVATGNNAMVMLYLVAFFLGCAETIFDNASQAILPRLVRKDQLERANGRMYAAELISNQFAGPPLGAFLFVAAAAAPFFLDSVSFVISAVLILSFSGSFVTPREDGAPRRTLRADIGEGLRWLWNHRLLRTLGIMLGIWNGVEMAGGAIFVLFALEILKVSELGFAVLASTYTVGSLIGTFAASRLSKLGTGTVLIVQVALGSISSLVVAMTSNAIVVGAMFALVGFAGVVWNVITVSLRQSIIPDHLLGRVNSVYRLLGWGMMPIGAGLGGLLASNFGLRAPFLVAGSVLAIMAILALPYVNNKAVADARAAASAEEA